MKGCLLGRQALPLPILEELTLQHLGEIWSPWSTRSHLLSRSLQQSHPKWWITEGLISSRALNSPQHFLQTSHRLILLNQHRFLQENPAGQSSRQRGLQRWPQRDASTLHEGRAAQRACRNIPKRNPAPCTLPSHPYQVLRYWSSRSYVVYVPPPPGVLNIFIA